MLLHLIPILFLLSSIVVVIAAAFVLVLLFFVFRIIRQRAAAGRVGVQGTVADVILGDIQEQVRGTLLIQEQIYERLRQNGEAAKAVILTMMDTSIRIGDQASMLRFSVEVFPKNRPPFRAETQNAISDATRRKFMAGSTVYVKFDPRDTRQVALDGAPADAPGVSVVDCPSCGAAQHVTSRLAACSYCGRPLARA